MVHLAAVEISRPHLFPLYWPLTMFVKATTVRVTSATRRENMVIIVVHLQVRFRF